MLELSDEEEYTIVEVAEQGPPGGAYSLPVATNSTLGGVKVGNNLAIDGNGVLSAGNNYVLPPANATTLGGVKVGSGLTVLANGLIEVSTSYLRDDAANGTLTITGDSGSTTSDLISEVTGSHQQSTVNNAGSYGFSNWYLRTSTASQVVVWGGYGIDTTSQSLSIGYNYAAQFSAGVSYGRSLKISGSDITLEQQTLGGATLPAKVWSANSVLTKGYADGQYLSYANFTYANLPGTPNLSVYLLSATANATFQPLGNYLAVSCLTFSNLTGKPTTLSGYGITDAYPLSGNPSGFLVASNLTVYAPLANPAFTGVPTAPNAANGTTSNQVATTQFVANTVSGYATKATAVTLNGIETLTNKTLSNATMTGTQYFNGTTADKVQLKSPRETFTSPTISSGTLALDLVSGTLFKVSLNAAISTIAIANTPPSVLFAFILEFTADGTSRAVTWPASFVWLSGSPPVVPSANGAILALVLYTTDGGTTWLAGRAGAA